jgi:hypothetical protein
MKKLKRVVTIRCKRIDNLSHVVPGWGCCKCNVYNSYQRETCKICGHISCYPQKVSGPDKMAEDKHQFSLRIVCAGAVDAPDSKCKKSIAMPFEIAGDKDLFIKAMDTAGWYASECGMGPNEGTEHVLTALCPTCASILLPKEVIDMAKHLRGDRQGN